MKKYLVLEASNAIVLERLVEGLLSKGWTFVGGISVTKYNSPINSHEYWYAQAMTADFDEIAEARENHED